MQMSVELSIAAITSGEAGGVSTTTKSLIARSSASTSRMNSGSRRRRGPAWSGRAAPGRRTVVGEVVVDLLGVEGPARRERGRRSSFGREAEAEPDVAELQIEVDQADRCPCSASATARLQRRHRLAGPALRAEDADQRRRNRCLVRASRRVCVRSPSARVPDALGRLRQGDDVVGTRGEDLLHEPVRIGAVELQDDDRPLGSEPGTRSRSMIELPAGPNMRRSRDRRRSVSRPAAPRRRRTTQHLDSARGQCRADRVGTTPFSSATSARIVFTTCLRTTGARRPETRRAGASRP